MASIAVQENGQHDDASKPYSPWKSLDARQANETISAFLERLPPSRSESIPPEVRPAWYWIANPHPNAYPGGKADTGDVEAFTREGSALLQEYRQQLAQCSEQDKEQRNQLRRQLRNGITEAAKKWRVISGKWMLSPKLDEVDDVWRAVCEDVVDNRLGTGAAVATSCQNPDDPVRLICVYTKDFTDREDVKRVLLGLVHAGLVSADMPRAIKYKSDAYSHLEIYAHNEYGMRPSLYDSKRMLKEIQRGAS